ncbi:hypothetical protein NQ176_g10671 [Zarea fungicola]|uniref:Uncharacterized protein n=1 Tax=Zarea fungicola TaxID=93591 RepID=A0ACC1ME66_9HYPO|nr:hypothetical protein NQ176_g10671 [Lecanicillium fungicola]
METPRLYIEDLRFEIGSIELTGPASTEALLAVLTPHPNGGKSSLNQAQIFQSLQGLTNPSALTANAVLAFSIQDPRLRYPPRRQEGWDDEKLQMRLMENIAEWPAERELEANLLFDRNARHRAAGLPAQQTINKRRSAISPGAFLKPTSTDPEIPALLLAARSASGTQTQGSWTLMLPWKCVLPVWHSLVHYPLISGGNPRFAGVNECMQVAFERSMPWFPADFLGTDAGAEWELQQREKRKTAYARRPKSKRTEWASLDLGAGRRGEVGDGLACDFELLFGLQRNETAEQQPDKAAAAAVANTDGMEGIEMTAAVPDKPKTSPLKLLNQVSKSHWESLAKAATSASLPAVPVNAIITIRVSILGRGVALSCARIYRLPRAETAVPASSTIEVPSTVPYEEDTAKELRTLPHNLRAQWLAKLPSVPEHAPGSKKQQRTRPRDLQERMRLLARELTAKPLPYPLPPANHDSIDGGHHPLVPDTGDLIGFVTSGSFNMAHGRGTAVGAIAVEKVLADLRATPNEAQLCIVRNAGQNAPLTTPPAIQSRLFKFDRYLRWSPLVFTVIIIPTTPYFVSQNFEQLYQQLAMETDIPTSVSGGCLCEKIRYTVTFPKGHSFIDATSTCQCSQCRKQTGSLIFRVHKVPRSSLEYSSQSTLKTYKASKENSRGFCSECGSLIFWAHDGGEAVSLCVGTFDNDVLQKHGKLLTYAVRHLYCVNDIPGVTDHLPGRQVSG